MVGSEAEDAGFLVGPSRCDASRIAREERLINAWRILISCRGYSDIYFIIGLDVDLFRESLSCYQNGAYMASILMCGVFLESLIYDLVSAIKGKVECDRKGRILSIKRDLDIYNLQFGLVIEETKRIGLMDKELENEINNIRNQRNFAAHYAQRLRKELSKTLEYSKGLKPATTIKSWVSSEEAFKVLEQTAKIANQLIKKAYSILERLCIIS